jgi:hypothetical protein
MVARKMRESRSEAAVEGGVSMKPRIDETAFGSITIEGERFEHDVLIRPSGQIEKRKKKLSKAVYGCAGYFSHKLSIDRSFPVIIQGPACKYAGEQHRIRAVQQTSYFVAG